MPFEKLGLSQQALALLRKHRIESIDQARTWTSWSNIDAIRELYVAHTETFREVRQAIAGHDQQKGAPFRDSYVAYIDILGFTQLVSRSSVDAEARETIRAGLRCYLALRQRHPNPDLHFSQFSDTIILSSARDENGLLYVLEAAIGIAFELLKVGLLVRGGIAAGHLEHTDEMLFGQALVDAYDLERSGGPPRIIVSETIMSDRPAQRLLNEIWSPAVFRDDHDLSSVVHILLYAQTYSRDDGSPITQAQARSIAEMIATPANDIGAPASIRAKWRWMARYWNRTVGAHGLLPAVELQGAD